MTDVILVPTWPFQIKTVKGSMTWNSPKLSISVIVLTLYRITFLFILRSRLLLHVGVLLLLGVVVHSLQKEQHLHVHRLREQIHGHGSHRTERGPVNPVGRRSAQTGGPISTWGRAAVRTQLHSFILPFSRSPVSTNINRTSNLWNSLDEVVHGRLGVARDVNESLQMLRPPDGEDHLGICVWVRRESVE